LRIRREPVLLAVLAALAAVVYLRPPGVAAGVDYVVYHSFDRHYWLEAVSHGRLPLWNPHVGLGRPFAADIQTATFYPLTLLYLTGPRSGLALSVLLHVSILALGMRLFSRRLGVAPAVADATALVAPFLAPSAVRFLLGQMAFVDAVCFIPLAFALALPLRDSPSPRGLALLAGVFGMQILAGHPQVGWVTWLAIALFFTGCRLHPASAVNLRLLLRDLALLGTGVIWGLGVASIVFLPFLELLTQSNRSVHTVDFASSFALPRQALGSLFLASSEQMVRMFGPENNLYASVIGAVAGFSGLAVTLGRRRESAGFALLLVVSLLLALGTQTPLFWAAYHALPGLAGFRFPSRLALPVPFVLLALAGVLLSEETSRRHRLAPWAIGAVALAASAWMYARVPRAWGAEWGWLGLRFMLLLAGTGLLWLWAAKPGARRACGAALLLLMLIDLGDALRVSRAMLTEEPPPGETVLAGVLQGADLATPGGVPPRVFVPSTIARHNLGMSQGFSSPAAYVAPSLDRIWTFLHEGIGVRLPINNTFPSPEVFAQPFPYRAMSLTLAFDPQTGRLVRQVPDPRAYVVSCAETLPTWHDAVARQAAGYDVHHCALVEEAQAGYIPGLLAAGSARIVSFAPERVVVAAESEGDALLVLAEAWYPGWRARIDGHDLPCLPVNAWMRAAVIPPGRHTVVFDYRSRFLWPGALVTVSSLIAIVVAGRRRPAAA
jgi:hypothetical protein